MKEFESGHCAELESAFSPQKVAEIGYGLYDNQIHWANLSSLKSPDLEFFFVLCPMYLPGDLNSSSLASPNSGQGIADSRVVSKWAAYTSIVEAESKYLKSVGGNPSVKAVFANRGVLLGNSPENNDHQLLEDQKELYGEMLGDFCQQQEIVLSYTSYDDYPGSQALDVFFDPKRELPYPIPEEYQDETGVKGVIWNLYQYLENHDLHRSSFIKNNKKTRRRIAKMIDVCGQTGAFWLMIGYLAFDFNIRKACGPNAVYLQAERFTPLFGIVSFTEGLKDMPRADISA